MAGAYSTKQIKDAGGNALDFRLWDESGSGAGPFYFASDAKSRFIIVQSSLTGGVGFTRQANATPYSAGDAVSNHATPGSVVAQTFTMPSNNDEPITVEELLMYSSDTGVGAKNLRVHLFNSDPTANSGVQGGDNLAWSQKQAGWIGSMVGTMLGAQDGANGRLLPEYGSRIITTPGAGAKTLWWLTQTIDGWTPSGNSTTFTPWAKGFQGHA